MNKNVSSIHHCSVIVQDTNKSVRFYKEILDLEVNHKRPDLGYPGAWLDVGSQQIHLLEVHNPDEASQRPRHGGRDRHVALLVESLSTIIEKLDANHCEYSLSKSGRRALFFHDPDGNAIEIIEKA